MKSILNLCTLIMLCTFINLAAQENPKITYSLTGKTLMEFSGNYISVSESIPGIDKNNLKQLNTPERITTIQNAIELRINNNFALEEDAEVKIEAKLTSHNIDGTTQPDIPIELGINFKSDTLQKSKISGIYPFTNAYKIDLIITKVDVIGEDESQLKEKLKDFVEVVLSFQMNRISKISYTAVVADLTSCPDQSTDELVIYWKPNDNAVEYELEYTFVDNYSDDIYTPIPPRNLEYNFKNNSTRISTKETHYRVPLLFERGYIIYRVRIVGKGGDNLDQPVYCIWKGDEKGIVEASKFKYYFSAAHMSDGMDWQSSITFSENGNRVDNVKYLDGTFRVRMDVTGANLERQKLPVQNNSIVTATSQSCNKPYTDKYREVIAGETIYDFQGRPSVTILPVPTNSLKIKYLPGLNISEDRRKPYNWEDFDKQNLICPLPNALSKNLYNNIMGAAAYYSENNPNKYGFNAFIPSAEGFPFTQIMYTRDNTDKISVQSGLGLKFKIGSGHETKFFYGAANQYELDRMFGTEVGYEERYQKNAKMDPNGQVVVTYLNPEGKTIATSLAGEKPSNLEALSSYKEPEEIEVSLISKNEINEIDKTLITEHQFIVTSPNSKHIFKYTIDPEILNAEKCDGTPVCLDCIYDFEIRLSHAENCDEQILFNKSKTIPGLLSSIPLDLTCSAPQKYSYDTTLILQIGTYTLTKKITVNKEAGIDYVNEVFKDTCRTKWSEILSEELSKIDTMKCYNSCTDCDQPPVPTASCDTFYCKPNPNRCDILRRMMMADVSPGGQYAQFNRDNSGNVVASAYPLSVFNVNNRLPKNYPTPINIYTNPDYFGGTNINNATTLVNNWRPEYAEKLMKLHPEYCKEGWCDKPEIETSLDFDVKIIAAQNYSDAVSKGFINPSGPDISLQLLNADPWLGTDQTYNGILKNYLLQFGCGDITKSIKNLAIEMAYCAFNNPVDDLHGTPQINSSSLPECILPSDYLNTHVFGSDNISPGNGKPSLADLEWTFLRTLYLSSKNRIIQSSMNTHSSIGDCDTRCIDDVWYWHGSFGISGPPCENSGFLYYNKEKRFGSDLKSMFKKMNEEGYAIDMSGIDFDDPCQIFNAIQSQSGSLNQQFSSIYCDTVAGNPCEPNAGLSDLFNTILFQFNGSSLTLSDLQLPQSVRNMGINLVNANKIGLDKIKILFQPMNYSMAIPYKLVDTSFYAPVSVCVTNILPIDTVSSFDMKVAYENNSIETLHFQTTFNITNNNIVLGNTDLKNSAYSNAVSKYINDIFSFYSVYNNYPNPAQLLNMLPAELNTKDNKTANSVSINTSGNLTIKIFYPKNLSFNIVSTHVKVSKVINFEVAQFFDTCKIILFSNANISNWSEAGQIISMKPDINSSNNSSTTNFEATLLKRSGNNTVQINGSAPCWQMNETGSLSLCDSIPKFSDHAYSNRCVEDLYATAYANASALYNEWLDSMKNDLLERYYAKCLKAVETLDMTYMDRQYHYTLYYYDQAGNLVKTVPPEGVRLLSISEIENVAKSRKNNYNTPVFTTHVKESVYNFNTLNELTNQRTPDAGVSDFYYDGLGRIVASQNEVQKQEGAYAYSVYDNLGRITESGKVKTNLITPEVARDFSRWNTFIDGQSTRTEITFSQYDEAYPPISQKFGQLNLRKRVASVLKFDNPSNMSSEKYSHATHYSYDIMGNVFKMIQDYPNTLIGDKKIEYEYDLQSGKVNSVIYQRGSEDQFIHKYGYDALNRLIRVKTSPDGQVWNTDAEYFYYRHGALARTELGTDKVQGLDYIYTLQGWIKGVNGTTLDVGTDMGRDGIINPQSGTPNTEVINGRNITSYNAAQIFGNGFNGPGYGTLHNPVARDAFGYFIEYYNGDYNPVNIAAGNEPIKYFNQLPITDKELFNGNISRMYTQIQKLGNTGFNYSYDQLNRFISQKGWFLKENSIGELGEKYAMNMKYDADGNIIRLDRNGPDGSVLDNFHYRYYTKSGTTYDLDPVNSKALSDATNRLAHINDNQTNNYRYNAIGNLTGDNTENIDDILWNLQNKIDLIKKNDGTQIAFQYDALGNRIMKDVASNNQENDKITYYVRDAQGNVLAVYSLKQEDGSPKLRWDEAHIYGSSRLGMYTPEKIIENEISIYSSDTRGYKQYELANHLGNVLATITDRKLPVTQDGKTTYTADVVTAQDYYPGGAPMPGQNFNANSYKYGAFGFEKDDEVKGSGNHYAFADYGYDPRLVRRWQIDPLANAFPWQSPYSALNNNPIFFTDPTGESGVASITDQKNKDGKPIMKVVSNVYIYGSGATDANAKTMQGNAMAQYNNNGNYFSATVDGVEYEVQFDIKVQVIDAKDVETKLLPGGYETLNAENNFYEMVDNPKSINNLGVTLSGEDKEGSRGGSTGFIKTSEAGTSTLSHELNHSYGGTNKDLPDGDETKLIENDIAVQDKNSTNPSSRNVTQGNIDAIFKNVDFKSGKTANVGNPRPQLYDNTTGESKSVSPK